MKKITLFLLILVFASTFAWAQSAVSARIEPSAQKIFIFNGVIIDNLCAQTQKPGKLAGFVKTHTKQCTLMPNCAVSGYSIYTDGKLYKFDKNSSVKILEFLKKDESKLEVTAKVAKSKELLYLLSIKNQN